MSWEKWSYWFNGGIIGSIIAVILLLPSVYLNYIVKLGGEQAVGYGVFYAFIFLPATIIMGRTGFHGNIGTFVFYITGILSYALIGAIIGWIIGKVKQRK